MYGRHSAPRHALVRIQFYDMPWSGRSFPTCMVGTQPHDMPWSGRSFPTCMVGTQPHDMPWSGSLRHKLYGLDTVLRHALVRIQFTTCPGEDAVLRHVWSALSPRHALVRIQFTTCPGQDTVYDMPWSGIQLIRRCE